MDKSPLIAKYMTYKTRPKALHDDPESIILGLTPLLLTYAKKLPRPASWELIDVLHIGLVAALECAPKFDPERGVAFATYGYRVAVNQMINQTVEARGAARVPHDSARLARKRGVELVQDFPMEFDAPVSSSDPNASAFGALVDVWEGTDDIEATVRALEVAKRLPARDRAALFAIARGETLSEHARHVGAKSRQAVEQRLIGSLKRVLGEDGVHLRSVD